MKTIFLEPLHIRMKHTLKLNLLERKRIGLLLQVLSPDGSDGVGNCGGGIGGGDAGVDSGGGGVVVVVVV